MDPMGMLLMRCANLTSLKEFPHFGAWKLRVFFFSEDFRGAQAGVQHFQRFVLKGSIKLNINCHLIKKKWSVYNFMVTGNKRHNELGEWWWWLHMITVGSWFLTRGNHADQSDKQQFFLFEIRRSRHATGKSLHATAELVEPNGRKVWKEGWVDQWGRKMEKFGSTNHMRSPQKRDPFNHDVTMM